MVRFKEICLFIGLWGSIAFVGSAQTSYTYEGDQSNLSYETLFNDGAYDDVTIDGNFTLDTKQDATLTIEKDKSFTITGNWIITCSTNLEIGEKDKGSAEVTIGGGFQSTKNVYLYEASKLTIGSESNENSDAITMGSNLKIYGTSVVEIWGDVNTGSQFYVDEDATRIIHGNLTMTGSSNNKFLGDVIVTGDVDMVKCTITSTGNFVVGGDFSMDEVESIDGEIYSIGEGSVIVGKNEESTSDYEDEKSLSDLEELAETDENAEELLEKLKEYGVLSDDGETVDRLWTGGTKTTSWTNKYNWSPNKVPDEESTVQIPKGKSYYPVIEGTVEISSLEISSGAEATLSAGAIVTIANDLKTNNNLIINHTLDNPASLLVSGTITGKVTVNLTDNFTYKVYRLLGVTADGVNLSDFDDSYTSGYYAYQYASNAWSKLTSDYDEFDDYPMRGYYIGSKGDGENFSYSGVLHNNASYTHTSPIRKWQLVCNPYPCYIDITSSGFTLDGNCEQAVYVRRSSDNEVQTYWLDGTTPVSVNSASNLLAPGQGFWVWAESSGAKITIAKAARTNSGGTIGFKSVSTASDVLKLKMTNGSLEDETVVVFRSDGSDSYSASDIDKMANRGTNINFYSLKDDNHVVINLMPELYDGEVIPLGYSLSSTTTEECTIEVAKISGLGNAEIYLDDLVEGTSVELSSTTEYTFTPSSSSEGRFQIRIASSESTEEEETTTGIGNATTVDNISVYASGETAYVTVTEEWVQSDSRMIYVYDVIGQLVKTVDLDDLDTQFALPGSGVYVIKVVSGSMIYTEKVLGE